MAIMDQAVVDGAQMVARAVQYQIRQAATSAITSATTSGTLSPSPTSTNTGSILTSDTTSPQGMPPSSTPTPDNSNDNNNNNNNNTGTSSPLLFFVALGFGVVFTNLWIIVGVKYCFRYNARNRQMRGLDENGEPINLENMPTRPHRRRREKKLMTMDEVNDKFPMMKYKTWVSDRAREGLPTAGGVSAPPSRANSVRSVEGIVPEMPSKEHESTEARTDDTATAVDTDPPRSGVDNTDSTSDPAPGTTNETTIDDTLTQARTVQTVASEITKDNARQSVDDEDDEQINAALPPELMGTSGDTCAICIDTLEDDDDVRGLTCGHAFHAVCLDPWLTNRRACCPLCKADYYTPKPRPAPADGDPSNLISPTGNDASRNSGRMNMPRAPQRTFTSWSTFREAPRLMIPARFGGGNTGSEPAGQDRPSRRRDRQRPSRPSRRNTESQAQPAPSSSGDESGNMFTRFRGRFPPFRLNQLVRRNRDEQPTEAVAPNPNTADTTPSQLEAGVRPSAN
ncbi:hypothetical protein F5Y15DRAFT_98689 [Xylariaceae sp. FL0016]|nr:hypothetical protein F5Y15DRAFT_98689 [Xylariaceae sp. FL0016]